MAEENIHKKDAMFGTSARDIASGKWIAVQRRVFTRWANAYLKQKRIAIEDITTDFADGVNLIALLEVLTREPPSFKYKKPTPEKVSVLICVTEWPSHLPARKCCSRTCLSHHLLTPAVHPTAPPATFSSRTSPPS